MSDLSEPEKSDNVSDEPSPLPLAPMPALARLKSDPDDQQEENENEEEPQSPQPDNQTLLRLLEENEKVRFLFFIPIVFLNFI